MSLTIKAGDGSICDIELQWITEPNAIAIQHAIRLQGEFDLNSIQATSLGGVSNYGFLISGHTSESLRAFIREGGTLLIATELGAIVAYCLLIPARTFTARHSSTRIAWCGETDDLQIDFSEGRFTYFDQMAVTRRLQGSRLAQMMHENLLKSLDVFPIFGAVLRAPIHNQRSESFLRRLGYREVGSLNTEQINEVPNVLSTLFAWSPKEAI